MISFLRVLSVSVIAPVKNFTFRYSWSSHFLASGNGVLDFWKMKLAFSHITCEFRYNCIFSTLVDSIDLLFSLVLELIPAPTIIRYHTRHNNDFSWCYPNRIRRVTDQQYEYATTVVYVQEQGQKIWRQNETVVSAIVSSFSQPALKWLLILIVSIWYQVTSSRKGTNV